MFPLATPAFGVTFTVHVVPLPVMLLIVPFVTVKSPVVSPVTDSLNVYVYATLLVAAFAVPATLSVTLTVGALASPVTLTTPVVDTFPATSVTCARY
jgi:hypothetical protein